MSRVEILKCDGCGDVIDATSAVGTLSTVPSMGNEDMDLCLGCVVDLKRFLQDHRMPVCDAPAPPKPAPHHPGTMGVQAR